MKLLSASILGVAVLMLSSGAGVAAQSSDGDSSVITQQNLFHPSRSIPPPPPKPVPAKAVAQPAPPPPPPPPKFELDGVVKVEGEKGMALLQEPQLTQGKSRIVTLGETVGPYTLVQIEPDRVRLESEHHTVVVLLDDPAKSRKAVAAVPVRQLPLRPQAPAEGRLGAPAPQASSAPAPPEVSAESPAVNPNPSPEPGAEKPNSIINSLQQAFGILSGQPDFPPIFTGRPQQGQ